MRVAIAAALFLVVSGLPKGEDGSSSSSGSKDSKEEGTLAECLMEEAIEMAKFMEGENVTKFEYFHAKSRMELDILRLGKVAGSEANDCEHFNQSLFELIKFAKEEYHKCLEEKDEAYAWNQDCIGDLIQKVQAQSDELDLGHLTCADVESAEVCAEMQLLSEGAKFAMEEDKVLAKAATDKLRESAQAHRSPIDWLKAENAWRAARTLLYRKSILDETCDYGFPQHQMIAELMWAFFNCEGEKACLGISEGNSTAPESKSTSGSDEIYDDEIVDLEGHILEAVVVNCLSDLNVTWGSLIDSFHCALESVSENIEDILNALKDFKVTVD